MPAALTTTSVSIRPASVSTAVTCRPRVCHPGRGHPFDDPDAQLPGALGQRGGHAHRVGPALVGDVEGGQHVVGAGQRPQVRQLPRRDLHVLDPEAVHPGRLAAQRLLPPRAGGQRDVPDRAEPGGVPGLLLQPGVQVPRVAAEEQRGLVRHPGRGDQPGRVPCRPGGQLVLLEQDHVGPAQVGQVVGDAAAGHPAADDHHLGPVRHSPARGLSFRIDRHMCLQVGAHLALGLAWRTAPGPGRRRPRAARNCPSRASTAGASAE